MNAGETVQALVNGKKIRCTHWDAGCYMYLERGVLTRQGGGEGRMALNNEMVYEIYEPPKKMKTVWQWRWSNDSHWFVDSQLFTEEDAKRQYRKELNFQAYEKHGPAIEVEA